MRQAFVTQFLPCLLLSFFFTLDNLSLAILLIHGDLTRLIFTLGSWTPHWFHQTFDSSIYLLKSLHNLFLSDWLSSTMFFTGVKKTVFVRFRLVFVIVSLHDPVYCSNCLIDVSLDCLITKTQACISQFMHWTWLSYSVLYIEFTLLLRSTFNRQYWWIKTCSQSILID